MNIQKTEETKKYPLIWHFLIEFFVVGIVGLITFLFTKKLEDTVFYGLLALVIAMVILFEIYQKSRNVELIREISKKLENIIHIIHYSTLFTGDNSFEKVLNYFKEIEGSSIWILAKVISKQLSKTFKDGVIIPGIDGPTYSELQKTLFPECEDSIYLTWNDIPKNWFNEVIENRETKTEFFNGGTLNEDQYPLHIKSLRSCNIEKRRLVIIPNSKWDEFKNDNYRKPFEQISKWAGIETVYVQENNFKYKFGELSDLDILSFDLAIFDKKIQLEWNINKEKSKSQKVGTLTLKIVPKDVFIKMFRFEDYNDIYIKPSNLKPTQLIKSVNKITQYSTFTNFLINDYNFSNLYYSNADKNSILEKIKTNENLTLEEAWNLININIKKEDKLFKDIQNECFRIKTRIFGGQIFPIVPLYVSSVCQEHCLYCNYRVENRDKEIVRARLNDEQLSKEVEFLVKKGFKVIELVYSTDPVLTTNNIKEHIEITHTILKKFGGGMVGLNSRPYSVNEYRYLKDSGLDFIVLWQETYDETTYKNMHIGNTEKSDFKYRLEAPERMIEAGFENIGLGILSGLSAWNNDWFFLMRHTDFLLKKYKNKLKNIILGLPRLKPAVGALVQNTDYIPSDNQYLLGIRVFNILFPNSIPFINSRENWNLCLEIAKGGGSLFTFDCKTIPGGYSSVVNGYQFPTYNFKLEEYIKKLNGNGLNPNFNWEFKNFSTS